MAHTALAVPAHPERRAPGGGQRGPDQGPAPRRPDPGAGPLGGREAAGPRAPPPTAALGPRPRSPMHDLRTILPILFILPVPPPPTSPAVRWGHRTVAVGIGRALHRYLFTPTGPSPVPSNRCRRRRRRRRSFSRFCIEYQSNVLLLFLDFTVRLRVGAFTGVQRFQMARTQRECPAWLPTGRPSGVKADGPVAADTPVLRKAFGTSGGRPDVLRMAQGRLDFFETLTQGLGGGGKEEERLLGG